MLKRDAWLSFFSQNDVALAIAVELSEEYMKKNKMPEVDTLKKKIAELYQEVPEN